MAPPRPTLTDLVGFRPPAAVGRIRRLVDGRIEDTAAFLYRSPSAWRVHRRAGAGLIAVGPTWWTRPDRDSPWAQHVDEHGREPHHDGYLQAMLFPSRLPGLTDRKTVVAAREDGADGSSRLHLDVHEPVPGRMIVDVAASGYVTRLEGRDDGRTVVLEMTADLTQLPPSELFDPGTSWEPALGDG